MTGLKWYNMGSNQFWNSILNSMHLHVLAYNQAISFIQNILYYNIDKIEDENVETWK